MKNQIINYNEEFKHVIGKPDKFTKLNINVNKFTLKFKLDPKILSNSQLFVFYISSRDGEIIVDKKDLFIEKCLLNKVSISKLLLCEIFTIFCFQMKVEIEWNNPRLYPAEEAMLKIRASSESLCAISAIDKSVLFLNDKKGINIHNLLTPFIQDRIPSKSHLRHCLNENGRKLGKMANYEILNRLTNLTSFFYRSFSTRAF